jgi:hypothetical protein
MAPGTSRREVTGRAATVELSGARAAKKREGVAGFSGGTVWGPSLFRAGCVIRVERIRERF